MKRLKPPVVRHVVPVTPPGHKQHDTSKKIGHDCWCGPRVTHVPGGTVIVHHNGEDA